ncbi:alpha/beta fold hydrolase [Ancylobacter terrae]|uniref:alpha/beta fold hydrolase n=1 Tax=Ancylobacter sp. sgz301288 TaxID=3342077 RepID=UPI00385E80EF
MTPDEAIRFIETADGRAVHVRTGSAGAHVAWRRFGSGTPLVLLHGGFGSWLHWLPVIGAIERHFELLVPDLPGFSESDPIPVDATPDLLAKRLAGGLEELLPETTGLSVAGFSFGGLVALHLAQELGPRLAGLVLIAGGGLGEERDPVDLRSRHPDMTAEEKRAVSTHNLQAFMIADPVRVDELAVEIQQRNTARRPGLNSRIFSRTRHALEILPAIAAPVAAIWGTRDPTVGEHLAARRRAVVAAAPHATTAVLPGCGHWIMQERPAELAAFLIETLTDKTPS